MAHMAHSATGTTATAARFSFFLVADHLDDDQRANEDKCKRDEDGCQILHDKVEYDHSVHLFLKFFGQLGRFLIGFRKHEDRESNEDKGNDKSDDIEIAHNGRADLIKAERNDISENRLIADGEHRPFAAVHFALDRAHCREAGCAEQVKYKEGIACESGKVSCTVDTEQNAERSNDVFFCDQSGYNGDGVLPITKAERRKEPGDCTADDSENGIVQIFLSYHDEFSVYKAKSLQEPENDGRKEDDGACFFDKGPAAFPHRGEYALGSRHMVGGKFHNEGSGFAREHLRFLENDTGKNNGGNADEVCADGNPPCVIEERACDQADDRELCAAGDKGRGDDGHTAVAFVFNGTGRHDAGNAAARSDEDRNKRFTGETEFAEDLIHKECDTGHIAARFEESKEEEQNEHLGNKAEHGTNTRDDTVEDQTLQPRSAIDGGEKVFNGGRNDLAEQNVVRPVRDPRTDGRDGYVIDRKHDCGEDGECKPSVRENLVDLVGDRKLAFVFLLIATLGNGGYVIITVVDDDAVCFVIKLGFGGNDILFDMCAHIFGKLHEIEDLFVSLEDFDRIPALLLGRKLVYDGFFDMSDGVLCRTAENVAGNLDLLRLSRFDGFVCYFVDARSLERRDLHDLTSESLGQLVDLDDVTVFSDDVHHIDGNDDGNTEFKKLCGEVKISFDIRSVHKIDDGIGALADQIVSCDDLLKAVGREGIDTGKVGDDHAFRLFELSFFLFNGNAGPVSYKLIGACECVKKRCFAGVRITGKGNT